TPLFGHGVTVNGGDIVFFSFTTLTTTGYGNLVPAGQPGQMFAGMEMLIGQIFLVTLVAGLVSLWRPGGLRGRGEALRNRIGPLDRDGGGHDSAPNRPGRPDHGDGAADPDGDLPGHEQGAGQELRRNAGRGGGRGVPEPRDLVQALRRARHQSRVGLRYEHG